MTESICTWYACLRLLLDAHADGRRTARESESVPNSEDICPPKDLHGMASSVVDMTEDAKCSPIRNGEGSLDTVCIRNPLSFVLRCVPRDASQISIEHIITIRTSSLFHVFRSEVRASTFAVTCPNWITIYQTRRRTRKAPESTTLVLGPWKYENGAEVRGYEALAFRDHANES